MENQIIPLARLDIRPHQSTERFSREVLANEIQDVRVEHVSLINKNTASETCEEGYRLIYLFVRGTGNVVARNATYGIVAETIFLPNAVGSFTIEASSETLHYLKISCKLSEQDKIELQALPPEHTQNVYHARFSDCQSYSEAIKSPGTVSRTILTNEYIPRVAMGTVQTKGPDNVAAHRHPMLEQLFLALSENHCTVHADDNRVDFPPYSVLHIPLGSNHSVSVEEGKKLYYVWMDFFLDKQGEDWLKTHKVDMNQDL